jgi:hypothetical protein
MPAISNASSTADDLARAGGRKVRRYVNESVYRTAREAGAADLDVRDFVCECGDLSCSELVSLPLWHFDESPSPGSITGHYESA